MSVRLEPLIGERVLTTDHVRRTIVAAAGDDWTDEDDITLGSDSIAFVIHGGGHISLEHAFDLRALNRYGEPRDY